MSTTFGELREVGVPVRRACELVGRARATHYRHARGERRRGSRTETLSGSANLRALAPATPVW